MEEGTCVGSAFGFVGAQFPVSGSKERPAEERAAFIWSIFIVDSSDWFVILVEVGWILGDLVGKKGVKS